MAGHLILFSVKKMRPIGLILSQNNNAPAIFKILSQKIVSNWTQFAQEE